MTSGFHFHTHSKTLQSGIAHTTAGGSGRRTDVGSGRRGGGGGGLWRTHPGAGRGGAGQLSEFISTKPGWHGLALAALLQDSGVAAGVI